MTKVATYTKTGNKSTNAVAMPNELLCDKKAISHDLVKQVYEAHAANARTRAAHSKNRSEVRGGGRKPWRQKGLGRARAGSIRSPIWRSGGVTFGPTEARNYHKKINAQAKKLALKQALTLKSNDVSIIEALELKEGKTKELSGLLTGKLKFERSILLVVDETDEKLLRAAANLPNVTIFQARSLHTKAVLDADNILITKTALEALKVRLGGTS